MADQTDECSCVCSHLFHTECGDVCTWNTLRLAFIETLGRWVADAVATDAVDEGLMPLVMTNPHAVDAGEQQRGLLHDDRERIARNIEAQIDPHGSDFSDWNTAVRRAARIVRERNARG